MTPREHRENVRNICAVSLDSGDSLADGQLVGLLAHELHDLVVNFVDINTADKTAGEGHICVVVSEIVEVFIVCCRALFSDNTVDSGTNIAQRGITVARIAHIGEGFCKAEVRVAARIVVNLAADDVVIVDVGRFQLKAMLKSVLPERQRFTFTDHKGFQCAAVKEHILTDIGISFDNN